MRAAPPKIGEDRPRALFNGRTLWLGCLSPARGRGEAPVASSNAIRIAHVTDAHVAPNGRPTATLKHRSCDVLSDVVAQCIARGVDLTLFGGDNIDNRGEG